MSDGQVLRSQEPVVVHVVSLALELKAVIICWARA